MKTVRTDLLCSKCGEIQSIQRRIGRQKLMFHIKDLYCPNCKEVTKHIELRDKDICYQLLSNKVERNELEEYVFQILDEKRKENGNRQL